jgi:hypothetical protein
VQENQIAFQSHRLLACDDVTAMQRPNGNLTHQTNTEAMSQEEM